jgi:hypothetical protein
MPTEEGQWQAWSCPALTDRFAESILSGTEKLVDGNRLVAARAKAPYPGTVHETAAFAALLAD